MYISHKNFEVIFCLPAEGHVNLGISETQNPGNSGTLCNRRSYDIVKSLNMSKETNQNGVLQTTAPLVKELLAVFATQL